MRVRTNGRPRSSITTTWEVIEGNSDDFCSQPSLPVRIGLDFLKMEGSVLFPFFDACSNFLMLCLIANPIAREKDEMDRVLSLVP